MRIFGIILIIVGILMFIFTGFNYQTKKRVVDMGPIQIDKTEDHSVGWPVYAGGLAILAGIVVLVVDKKKV
jgi:UDP-N-acetylmuramyl pentapeptide phosphotransferase/UDP-N-acetylglucosamine-1-phosphate transferase